MDIRPFFICILKISQYVSGMFHRTFLFQRGSRRVLSRTLKIWCAHLLIRYEWMHTSTKLWLWCISASYKISDNFLWINASIYFWHPVLWVSTYHVPWPCIFVLPNTKMTTEYRFRSFAVYLAFIRWTI
jgi:hypothetical protein